jgi:hypothetical protein
MKALFFNRWAWLGGSLCAVLGALEVRVVSAMEIPQLSGPGYLAAGLGLMWIACAVGRRVSKEEAK